MKYLKRWMIAGVFLFFLCPHGLRAMTAYHAHNTEELAQYLDQRDNANIHSLKIIALIEKGAHPDARGFGRTALHFAAKEGEVDLIQYLLQHGADIEARNDNKYTPLLIAAYYGHKKAAALLIHAGAQIEAINNDCDNTLTVAVRRGNVEIIALLIQFGLNAERALSGARGESHKMLSTYYSRLGTLSGENDLSALIRIKNNDLLAQVLRYFPNDLLKRLIHEPDAYGNTAFDIAVGARNGEGMVMLLDFGANPFGGLYDGVFLASRLPEWKNENEDGKASFYEHINKAAGRYYLAVFWALRTELPKELYSLIIRFLSGEMHPQLVTLKRWANKATASDDNR